MFNRLLSSRLRAAEQALREGRIDETYRLATADDLRNQSRAVTLLNELVPKFIERAEIHLAADRFAEALQDLVKAEAGKVMHERIAQLRANIRAVSDEVSRKEKERRDRLQAVRDRLNAGSLDAGQRLLEAASISDQAAHQLKKNLEQRRDEARAAYERSAALLKEGHVSPAVQWFLKGQALQSDALETASLESALVEAGLRKVREALIEGRPGRAADEMISLETVGKGHADRRELDDVLRSIATAKFALDDSLYGKAKEAMHRVQRQLPAATWAKQTADDLGRIEECLTAVRSGPLGEVKPADRNGRRQGMGPVLDETLPIKHRVRQSPAQPRDIHAEVHGPGSPMAIHDRLLVLIDDGGSYLVLRHPRVSIGRAASTNPPDIPMFSDLTERHADLQRVDDDYFLFSGREIEVGGRRTRHHLLRSGDRVVLGNRAKFTFRLPSRRSPSAVLDLSDSSRLPHDVRRVVVFKDSALIGRGSSVHLSCNGGSGDLVLFDRGGELWLRPQGHGSPNDAIAIPFDQPVEMDGVRMVVKPWNERIKN